MTRLERREQALHRLILLNKDKTECQTERSGHKKRKVMVEKVKSRPTIPFTLSEALPYTPPEYHHHISPSRNFPIHIHTFLNSTRVDDPAVVVSLIMLIKELTNSLCKELPFQIAWSSFGKDVTSDLVRQPQRVLSRGTWEDLHCKQPSLYPQSHEDQLHYVWCSSGAGCN